MRTVIAAIALATAMLTLSGCGEAYSTSKEQELVRDTAMSRATQSVSVPEISNFLTREYVAEYMRRMDEPNKTFYVYVIANTGQILGYYVARSMPVNICTFLTPTDQVDRITGRIRDAPGADGVYYGSGACNTEYFFDAETDALVQIQGLNLFVSDHPLEMDANPIRVKTTN